MDESIAIQTTITHKKQKTMNQDIRDIEPVDDEISLWELLEHLKSGWKWVVGGGVIGFAGAIMLTVFIQEQYEANVVLKISNFYNKTSDVNILNYNTTIYSNNLDNAAETLEQLKLVTFYSDDIVKACDADSAEDIANNLKVNLVKNNSHLLFISYRAESAALANACTSKIVTSLSQSQTATAAPLIKELQDQQTSTKQQIDEAERFFAEIEKRPMSSPGSTKLFFLMMLKRDDLYKLQALYNHRRIQLTEPLTHPVKLLAPISVSKKTVAPKKLIIIASSLIGGMFIGLLALFAKRTWRRFKGAATLA